MYKTSSKLAQAHLARITTHDESRSDIAPLSFSEQERFENITRALHQIDAQFANGGGKKLSQKERGELGLKKQQLQAAKNELRQKLHVTANAVTFECLFVEAAKERIEPRLFKMISEDVWAAIREIDRLKQEGLAS